jgi:hypothetical protein
MAETQSKKIRQLTLNGKLIKIHPSVKDTAISINVTSSVIIETCKGKQKTSGGFKWEYA